MGVKSIAIIGGGISGLAVLHYLKKRFKDGVQITLYERNASVGGNIQSVQQGAFLFETGPNGFLSNSPQTLSLIEDLDLKQELISAEQSAARRYIQLKGRLLALPTGPISLLTTPLLSFQGKWDLVGGVFKSKISKDKSINAYATQRFGKEAAQCLFDPFISGIYAGDTRCLHMASCFPRKFNGKSRLMSFKQGMGTIIDRLFERYQENIQTGIEITDLNDLKADHLICAVPAYAAAPLLNMVLLGQISYAPIAVVGLAFDRKDLSRVSDGFGYLVPSGEGKDILGVLLESHVLAGRAPEGSIVMRVMLGGARHPAIMNDSAQTIMQKAVKEIDAIYGLKNQPKEIFIKMWPKAIPQYDLSYPQLRQFITEALINRPNVHLCANYLGGISFNDCINNAKSIADSITL